MNITDHFKRISNITAYMAIFILIASCGGNKVKEDSKDVAEEHNDAKFDNAAQSAEAQFLVNAAEMNLEAISIGQLAQQNSTSIHVQELGKLMKQTHSKSFTDLTTLAKDKLATIPTSPTEAAQNDYKELTEKSGIEFDKHFADLMVREHTTAISAFEKASVDFTDEEIRNWATSMLPILRTNLDQAINCKKLCEKM